jgi:hypothetical protein
MTCKRLIQDIRTSAPRSSTRAAGPPVPPGCASASIGRSPHSPGRSYNTTVQYSGPLSVVDTVLAAVRHADATFSPRCSRSTEQKLSYG